MAFLPEGAALSWKSFRPSRVSNGEGKGKNIYLTTKFASNEKEEKIELCCYKWDGRMDIPGWAKVGKERLTVLKNGINVIKMKKRMMKCLPLQKRDSFFPHLNADIFENSPKRLSLTFSLF